LRKKQNRIETIETTLVTTETMAHMSMMKKRKENRRNQRIYEIFQERDPDGDEKIGFDQLKDIYRIYEVEFDEDAAIGLLDRKGFINRENFFEFAINTKLVDFLEKKEAPTPKKQQMMPPRYTNNKRPQPNKGLCCCGERPTTPDEEEERVDRVEHAFKKMDRDNNGFITWVEFAKKAHFLTEEQSKRIFQACDRDGDGKITVEDLKTVANKYVVPGTAGLA